jgi:putative ABC transport system permease protein
MLKNNLKIALRNLLRQKIYTFINVAGLAVGVASCLLIVLFIRNEFSYDKFFDDHDRIYRMVLERKYPNHSTYYAIIPHSFEDVARRDFAEIEESTEAFRFTNVNFSYTNDRDEPVQFDEEMVLVADSTFFNVFHFSFVQGDASRVLKQANEMVVTREFAQRYFGATDPIDKLVRGAQQDFKVVAVLDDVPENSHFKFSAILSALTFPFAAQENYTGFNAYTYFKLRPGTSPRALESKIPTLVDTYAAAQIERNLGKSWEDYKREGNGYRYFLQPLTSIHLDPTHLEAQMKVGGNITSVYIMIAVAVLVLAIACINFMNLATARSAERAREVGVRKVMGSVRSQLVKQFLTEAFVLSAIGVGGALLIMQLSLPLFNSLIDKKLVLSFDPLSVGVLVLLTAVVGLLAGLYPAFVLSSFNPVVVMKGKFTGSNRGKWIRNGLVVFQFWISIVLMIGTLVIGKQMNYMQEKSLGFDKEQVLVVERGFFLNRQQASTFIDEINALPEVERASGAFALPGREDNFFGAFFQPEGSSEVLTVKSMVVSDGLLETLGVEFVDGKSFAIETQDSLSILINETAARILGYDDPIGRKLTFSNQGPDGNNILIPYTITGIVKDFNFMSLRDQVTPLVIQSNETFPPDNPGQAYFAARIKAGQIPSAIRSVEAKWKQIAPDQAFRYTFLNEDLKQLYLAEQQAGRLFSVFAGLALVVACIGLFALSAYITSLRTKEIGVRKVLGASVSSVVVLLSKDFTKMIVVAYLLAVPLAWYVMEHWWLQNFAYRIQISAWIILTSGVVALVIAWLTVSYQSIKAATSDPVKSLRYE